MEMYIGYVDMIENIFEVHTYTIESENEKDYILTRNILPHLTPTTDYKNIPKKCEKVDILELDEMCVSSKKNMALDCCKQKD